MSDESCWLHIFLSLVTLLGGCVVTCVAGSILVDSFLAISQYVPQGCLKTAPLPLCHHDMSVKTGCCSASCQEAIQKVVRGLVV